MSSTKIVNGVPEIIVWDIVEALIANHIRINRLESSLYDDVMSIALHCDSNRYMEVNKLVSEVWYSLFPSPLLSEEVMSDPGDIQLPSI